MNKDIFSQIFENIELEHPSNSFTSKVMGKLQPKTATHERAMPLSMFLTLIIVPFSLTIFTLGVVFWQQISYFIKVNLGGIIIKIFNFIDLLQLRKIDIPSEILWIFPSCIMLLGIFLITKYYSNPNRRAV